MNTINLICNHCGAPLEVTEGTNFVTCRFCSSRLAIEHSESAFYTRVIEAIEQQTNALSQDLETIKVQNEVERLDREWRMERERLCHRTKSGRLIEPTATDAGCMAFPQIAFGLAWFGLFAFAAVASDHAMPGFFSIVGLVIAIFGIVVLLSRTGKADHFESRRSAYDSRRARLVAELDHRNANG
jgi:hypothetical protein